MPVAPLTDEEKMLCKQILGLPEHHAYTFDGDDPDRLLEGAPEHVVTRIRTKLLPAWEAVDLDTDDMDTEGLTIRPAKTRAIIRTRLAGLLGFKGLRGSQGGGGPRVVR